MSTADRPPHPLDTRPQIGTEEARLTALVLCAVVELERRLRSQVALFAPGEIAMQVSLADNETDLALIGRMAGRAGAACFAMLGIGPGGTRLPGGPTP
jgi:hypothetical protein